MQNMTPSANIFESDVRTESVKRGDADPGAAAQRHAPVRIAIAGLGAVGMAVARALDDEGTPGCTLVAVSAQDKTRARQRVADFRRSVPVVELDELEPLADVVVECAPSHLLPTIAGPFLRKGKSVIVLSAGALLVHEELIDQAREYGGQIIVPTGALLGLDAVAAAAVGTIHSVRMTTRKPVRGLSGAPFLSEQNIDIAGLEQPLRIFSGTAREAAKGFPANLNVAVALALAGIGPDRTMLEIWADPDLDRNTHHIEVDSDAARFSMQIENIPTDNPRTGRITAQSVIAYLRKLRAPLRVGS